MKLDNLLSTLTVPQLQDLADVWTPDADTQSSKSKMFRLLRDAMIQPANIARAFEQSDAAGRGIVRKILRSDDVSLSVAVLAASSAAKPKNTDEILDTVRELAGDGLVFVEPENLLEGYSSARVSIVEELVEPLREITGIDGRPWPQILNLADYLAALPKKSLAKIAKTAGATDIDDIVAALTSGEPARARLANLSDDLRQIVVDALQQKAGFASVAKIHKALGFELAEIKNAATARWRAELEDNLIGTIGDVSLLEYGIDIDGKMLVVFSEVTEALLSAPLEGEYGVADPVGPDFVLDLLELVSTVRETGARLKASGAVASTAAQRIISKLNRRELPLIAPLDLLELKILCAEKLGLIERREDSLAVLPSARDWEAKSYEDKAADLFGLVGMAVPSPRSKHHNESLCAIARGLIRQLPMGGEFRSPAFISGVAIRRYLHSLRRSNLKAGIERSVSETNMVLAPFPSLRRLSADLYVSVFIEAYAMGIIDTVTEKNAAAAIRLSEFGATAVKVEHPHAEPAQLIVMPDFQIIILPEGDTTRLRYDAGQFASNEKFEQTYHLRIERERVEEAVVRGVQPDAMIALLRRHSGDKLPQNIEFSIKSWSARVRVATIERAYIFELPDETTLSLVAELPGLKPLIIRRVSPTALALSQSPDDRQLMADLAALGVYIR